MIRNNSATSSLTGCLPCSSRFAAADVNEPVAHRSRTRDRYDVIVIGGGHAGVEAAWAAAGLGASVLLVTMDPTKIGAMSCNPAIGGLAKGQIVREIDALDGVMGRAIDATGIQFRVLNTSRGAAVHGPRAQADKYRYAREVQRILSTRTNIEIDAATVDELMVDDRGVCIGAMIAGAPCRASAVVLTTGTFMRGLMHTGEHQTRGGRVDEGSAEGISGELRRLGFELGRLKTGTPPRLAAESIDFASLVPQPGDEVPQPFSELSPGCLHGGVFPALPQVNCWTTHTTQAVHDIIRANLDRAPMYCGQIEAESGPRYCPSIEDKVVRFADRDAHHVFLEPESLSTNEIYCNGISTSLPRDVQDLIVPMMAGCERARILRYGYAVEYDMVWPHQIDATCMTKRVPGLFLAGQINGTSGYEEAAGQGLVAGLNAVRAMRGEDPFRFGRDTSYIGVMLDDLVTKTPREPYRMFTSRAEYRLQLRADNAPDRLTPIGRELGLVSDERWQAFIERRHVLADLDRLFETTSLPGNGPRRQTLAQYAQHGSSEVSVVLPHLRGNWPRRLVETAFQNARYAPLVARQESDIRKMRELESRRLPEDFDFSTVRGLRSEAVHVLEKFRPRTLGQAQRLAGVNPADLTLIVVALRQARSDAAADVDASATETSSAAAPLVSPSA